MRILIYARVSTDMQKTLTQVDLCKDLAKKHSKEDPLIFLDEDCSSRTPMKDRVQLQKFLDAICIGDLVVVYSLDRIGRDILEGITIYREIKYLGAKITSVLDEHCDNEFVINIKFSMAQEERRLISERTKDALHSKQTRLEKVGAVWYGYQLDPNVIQENKRARTFDKPYKLIPHPKEQEALAIMRDMYSTNHSYQEIADTLTNFGYLSRSGKPFLKGSIHRILKRELTHPTRLESHAHLALAEI